MTVCQFSPVINRIMKCAKIFAYRYQFLILWNINSIEAYWHYKVQAPEAFHNYLTGTTSLELCRNNWHWHGLYITLPWVDGLNKLHLAGTLPVFVQYVVHCTQEAAI